MVIQKTKSKDKFIARMDKKIVTLGTGKYGIIIPKPLIDSEVLKLDKDYEITIK